MIRSDAETGTETEATTESTDATTEEGSGDATLFVFYFGFVLGGMIYFAYLFNST